jgi:hypothetical protein
MGKTKKGTGLGDGSKESVFECFRLVIRFTCRGEVEV